MKLAKVFCVLFLMTSELKSEWIELHLAFPEKYEGHPATLLVDTDKIVTVIQYDGYSEVQIRRLISSTFIAVNESSEDILKMLNEAKKGDKK